MDELTRSDFDTFVRITRWYLTTFQPDVNPENAESLTQYASYKLLLASADALVGPVEPHEPVNEVESP